MGQKLYKQTSGGGIRFVSHRRGEVRVPNYVYDIWLPLLGAGAITLYSVYCRLEREGTVRSITQVDIARACRIGKATLRKFNATLQECGFIKVTPPSGHQRLMHWTVTIEVFEAPTTIPKEIVKKYQAQYGYQPLSKWLVDDSASAPQSEAIESPEVLNKPTEVLYRTPVGSEQNPQDCIPCKLKTDSPAQKNVQGRESSPPTPVKEKVKKKRKKRGKGVPHPEDHKPIIGVLAHACRVDLRVASRGKQQIMQTSKLFRQAGYRPEDVEGIVRFWWREDWRGQKGQVPTPAQLRDVAGKWKAAKHREDTDAQKRAAYNARMKELQRQTMEQLEGRGGNASKGTVAAAGVSF